MANLSGAYKIRSSDGSQFVEDFRELADRLVGFGSRVGVRIIGYRDSKLPLFRALAPETQESIVRELKFYLEICEETLANGHDLRNSKQLVWYAMRKFGFVPPSNMFDLVDDSYVVEVHDRELHQVFRNFVFYEYCSYSLEELHCRPWPELYKRDQNAMASMLEVVDSLLANRVSWVDCRGIKHFISETESAFRYDMNYELVYAFALKDKARNVEAMLLCEKAEILNAPSIEDEGRMLNEYLKNGPLVAL